MRRHLLILGILISFQIHATTWEHFGPEGIIANRICFFLDNHPHWGICHNNGLCLYDLVSHSWTDHPTTIPVLDAFYLDGEKILVIMGNGTDSDWIYRFIPASNQFDLIKFVDSPHFICYCQEEQSYYIGHHLGLLTSNNGIDWLPVGTFNNKNMVDMDTYQNHFAVSEMDNQYGVWCSDDYGINWYLSPLSPMISSLGFDNLGCLYGIFPDYSYSSGLWSSQDFGMTWEVEFWSTYMSCVGFDFMNVFVGWGNNPTGPENGIAWYHPETGDLTFINANLPNLVIHQVTHNPSMSAIALFCCTDTGAYVSYDYFLDVPESFLYDQVTLSIFPNPVTDQATLTYPVAYQPGKRIISLFYMTGEKIYEVEVDCSGGKIILDCTGLASGIYIVELKEPVFTSYKKMIVQ